MRMTAAAVRRMGPAHTDTRTLTHYKTACVMYFTSVCLIMQASSRTATGMMVVENNSGMVTMSNIISKAPPTLLPTTDSQPQVSTLS